MPIAPRILPTNRSRNWLPLGSVIARYTVIVRPSSGATASFVYPTQHSQDLDQGRGCLPVVIPSPSQSGRLWKFPTRFYSRTPITPTRKSTLPPHHSVRPLSHAPSSPPSGTSSLSSLSLRTIRIVWYRCLGSSLRSTPSDCRLSPQEVYDNLW